MIEAEKIPEQPVHIPNNIPEACFSMVAVPVLSIGVLSLLSTHIPNMGHAYPTGVEPAEAKRFIKECWTLQGVAYVVIGVRYFSRIRQLGWHKLALDDGFMLLALVSSLGFNLLLRLARGGHEAYFSPSRHPVRLHSRERHASPLRFLVSWVSKQRHDRRATSYDKPRLRGVQTAS